MASSLSLLSVLVILFTIVKISESTQHTCIHDQIAITKFRHHDTHDREKRLLDEGEEEEGDYAPLRIHIVYDNSFHNYPFLTDLRADPSSPYWRAINTISQSLLVRPLQSNLTIEPFCDTFTNGTNEGECIASSVAPICGGIYSVPSELVTYPRTCVDEESNCTEGYAGEGANTDYILIVGAVTTFCTGSALAYAGPCDIIGDNNRPSAGLINICPLAANSSEFRAVENSLYNIMLHELGHAFGFSLPLLRTYYRYNSVIQVPTGSGSINAINSSVISQFARDYYNCSTLDYVPLDNLGTSHWNLQTLLHELMIPRINDDYMVYSNFTLGLFHDSGWYKVNYTFTESIDQYDMVWGKGHGCEFLLQDCTSEPFHPPSHTCNSTDSVSVCTFDHVSKGTCGTSFFHYPTCELVYPSTPCNHEYYADRNTPLGIFESFGKTSRCFKSTAIGCDEAPACLNTTIYQYTPTGHMAYTVQGSDGEVEWCRDGTTIELGNYLIDCPLVSTVILHTNVSDIIQTNTVPPSLCHTSCATCSSVNNPTGCTSCSEGSILLGPAPARCNTTVPDETVCIIQDPLRVTPFHSTGAQVCGVYNFHGICEHVIAKPCNSTSYTVVGDFLSQNLTMGRIGIRVSSGFALIDEGLGVRNSTPFPAGVTVAKERDGSGTITKVTLGYNSGEVRIERTRSDIRLFVRQGTLCGLCGSLDGVLVSSDGMRLTDLMNQTKVNTFANSWRQPANQQILREDRRECAVIKNDTVIGDPLFEAALWVGNSTCEYSLCYEIHGSSGQHFNLLSDMCVSVNAHYTPMRNPSDGNIISAIGIRASDDNDRCHNIEIIQDQTTGQCVTRINGGNPMSIGSENNTYPGINVKQRMSSRVRIGVPNCERVPLIMWVTCQNMSGELMMRFDISRAVNLRPSSHGLLGQFYNIRMQAQRFTNQNIISQLDPRYYDINNLWVISVMPPSGTPRRFVAELYERTWDNSRTPCLYAGTSQGGAAFEFLQLYRDSVIEGHYTHYRVSSRFATNFAYERFDEMRC